MVSALMLATAVLSLSQEKIPIPTSLNCGGVSRLNTRAQYGYRLSPWLQYIWTRRYYKAGCPGNVRVEGRVINAPDSAASKTDTYTASIR